MFDDIFEILKVILVIILSMFFVVYYAFNVNPDEFDFILITVIPFFVGYGSVDFFKNLILGDINE